jgi:hypothetical protein
VAEHFGGRVEGHLEGHPGDDDLAVLVDMNLCAPGALLVGVRPLFVELRCRVTGPIASRERLREV